MDLLTASGTYVSERKRNLSLAATSLDQLNRILWRFGQHMGQDRDVASITFADVSEWLASLTCGAKTKRCYVSEVRGLFEWLIIRDEIGRDPFLGLRLPKSKRALPRALEPEMVATVLDAVSDTRELLIALLMVQEGLRACEVAGLGLSDVVRSRSAINVRKGKGDKQRQVPLTDETRLALNRYLAEHPPFGPGPLIRSVRDPRRGLTAHYLSSLMTKLFYRSGVKEYPRDGRSGHAFRHTAASDVLLESGDITVVKEFLGHEDIGTTAIYLRVVGAERLRASVNGRTYQRPVVVPEAS